MTRASPECLWGGKRFPPIWAILSEELGLADYRQDPAAASYYNQRLAAYKEEKACQEAEFAEFGYIKRLAGEE